MDVIVIDSDDDDLLDFDAFDRPEDVVVVEKGTENAGHAENGLPVDPEDIKAACRQAALQVFPDLCPNFLEELAAQYAYDHEQVISAIVDQNDQGKSVPKRQRVNLKRKRGLDDVGDRPCDLKKKYDNDEWRQRQKPKAYGTKVKEILRSEFPDMTVKEISQVMDGNNQTLFQSYLRLVRKEADDAWRPKKYRSKTDPNYADGHLDETINRTRHLTDKMALEELKIARQAGEALRQELLNDKQQKQDEADNIAIAIQEGTMAECECCCDEFPLNRMVHCNGDSIHWFCRGCARMNAETQIGMGKFELNCMSMNSCAATFSRDQQAIFIDKNTAIALERIEQEAALRLAGIENLETCPFCPFAAEYPPVEEDKEFRCLRADCEIVSCRLCRKETHIPKTCAEVAQEEGHSGRRLIEEAMSAALIRRCNKCQTPFIKESGCNKMTCSQAGCRNVQCYVCNKSCDYTHFNDVHRGGKNGNCPLFDQVDERHAREVQKAEEEARKKALEEHPDVDAEVFKIKVSDKVKEDEEMRRKKAAERRNAHPLLHLAGIPVGQLG
ncbi:ring finger protein [Coniochaeta sp. 2T2.1]|nr:ring finger protein [Coniochaeta sp. 2T2.1]